MALSDEFKNSILNQAQESLTNKTLPEFDSFVVTNPDLVDPGIDVSNLKTTTDASILGNIPDYGGIQYEAYNPNRLSDLMRLYSGGFPMLNTDTAQIPGAVDTLVDTGGGGGSGATLPGFDVDSPKNTQDGLTQSGTFGGQPTFTTTPGTTVDDITGDITNPDGSYGGNIVDEVALTGRTTVDNVTGDITNPDGSYGGNIVDEFKDPTQNLNNIDLGNPFNDPRVVSEEFGLVGTPSYIDPIMDSNLMDIRQQQNQEATTLGSQINSAFENVKDQGTSAIESFKDTLVELGGKVKEGFDNVIEFGDTQIDVGKTLATGAINYIGKSIFGPVGAVLGTALGALELEGGRGDVSDSLAKKYGRDDIGRLTTGPMTGYSVGPNFTETVQERIDNIKNRTAPQTDASRKTIEELETIKAEAIAAGSGGVITEPGTVVGPGEFPDTQETFDEFNEVETFNPGDVEAGLGTETINDITSETFGGARYGDGGPGYDGPPSETANDGGFGNTEGPRGGDPYGGGEGGVQSGLDSPDVGEVSSDAGFSGPPSQSSGGGGGNGGGGKIVCTMMNDSYGFGSFRNKIWLKHSKNMAPEYQIGYHKIFLPLVKLSKTNNVVKKVLEHIAIHRTIDIRQESRGKTHLLGRVYRKILEPICYIVGKYAK